jgi:hypothetical protein
MRRNPMPLDLVQLDRIAIVPRASTLHYGGDVRVELRNSPWWVYLASRSLPDSLVRGPARLAFRASTAGGRTLCGDVTIVERVDDARGTRLILGGIGPIERTVAR